VPLKENSNVSRYVTTILPAIALLALAGPARAQFNANGATTLSVNVGSDAAIQINTGNTAMATTGGAFSSDYTGQTSLIYKIRTSSTGGTGSITLRVTSDFNAGGPSVASPPTSSDALTYTCSINAPGTSCTGTLTPLMSASTSVATFGSNAKSAKAGNSGTVSWTLPNDPLYSTGTYSATITFTISAA
jgi:hypothetical protein